MIFIKNIDLNLLIKLSIVSTSILFKNSINSITMNSPSFDKTFRKISQARQLVGVYLLVTGLGVIIMNPMPHKATLPSQCETAETPGTLVFDYQSQTDADCLTAAGKPRLSTALK